MAARASKLDITGERILEELAKLAFLDTTELYDSDGNPKPLNEVSPDARAAIEGIDIEELYQHFGGGNSKSIGKIKRYKIAGKLKALELLGKYRKLFTEKIEHSGEIRLAEAVEAGRRAIANDD